eukprot:6479169-Amphidinium_carterae.1
MSTGVGVVAVVAAVVSAGDVSVCCCAVVADVMEGAGWCGPGRWLSDKFCEVACPCCLGLGAAHLNEVDVLERVSLEAAPELPEQAGVLCGCGRAEVLVEVAVAVVRGAVDLSCDAAWASFVDVAAAALLRGVGV